MRRLLQSIGLLLALMSASTAGGTDGAGDDVARQLLRADRLFAATVAELDGGMFADPTRRLV